MNPRTTLTMSNGKRLVPYAGAERRAPRRRPPVFVRRRGVHPRIGKKIRRARLEQGIRLKQMAAALGTTIGPLQHYEAGRSEVSASRLFAIAKILRKPIGWFFE